MQYSHRNLLIHFCSRLNASLWSKAHLFRKVFRFNLSPSSEVQSTTFNSNFYWNCNADGLREELLTFTIFFLFFAIIDRLYKEIYQTDCCGRCYTSYIYSDLMNSFSIFSGVNGLWYVSSATNTNFKISEVIPIYTR